MEDPNNNETDIAININTTTEEIPDDSECKLSSKTVQIIAWSGNPGHVALRTNNIYASLWPNQLRNKCNSIWSVPVKFNTYYEDCIKERAPPDHIVSCNCLDVPAIEEAYTKVRDQEISWNICGSSILTKNKISNCAGLIAYLLKKGGIDNHIDEVDSIGYTLGTSKILRATTWLVIMILLLGAGISGASYLGIKDTNGTIFRGFLYVALIVAIIGCCLTIFCCVGGPIINRYRAAKSRVFAYTPASIVRYVKQANQFVEGVGSVPGNSQEVLLKINEPWEMALNKISQTSNFITKTVTIPQFFCCIICCPMSCLISSCFLVCSLRWFMKLRELEKLFKDWAADNKVSEDRFFDIDSNRKIRRDVLHKQCEESHLLLRIALIYIIKDIMHLDDINLNDFNESDITKQSKIKYLKNPPNSLLHDFLKRGIDQKKL